MLLGEVEERGVCWISGVERDVRWVILAWREVVQWYMVVVQLGFGSELGNHDEMAKMTGLVCLEMHLFPDLKSLTLCFFEVVVEN